MTRVWTDQDIDAANKVAIDRMMNADPEVVDVRPVGDVAPGMTPNMILTSGPTRPFEEFFGGQRQAIIGGALYEGLAANAEEAVAKIERGEILVEACHDHGCVGSVAGIYTASMPVFVVRSASYGNYGFCNIYEGKDKKRLCYGVYDQDVHEKLIYLRDFIGPFLGEVIRNAGGIKLDPIMRRALNMGDELHSRNTAASFLFSDQLFPHLLDLGSRSAAEIKELMRFLTEDNYFFLRLGMAAAKTKADAASAVEGSSIVTAQSISCRDTVLRVSGLGQEWSYGSLPDTSGAKLFDGFTLDDIAWMGGESVIMETVGLGGFAQACAFTLQAYQGGTPDVMVNSNLDMYDIAVGEHDMFKIPFFGYRGTPVGIDIRKVVETGILPVVDAGLAGKNGGQIGAGIIRMPIDLFQAALDKFDRKYRGKS